MTDKKDDYYQPWLRDHAPPPDATSAPSVAPDEGLAKPRAPSPVGIDPVGYDAFPASAPHSAAAPAPAQATVAKLWQTLRRGAESFADWTIRVGERADIPARVEALEIPQRTRVLTSRAVALSGQGARAIGRGSARAARTTARASSAAWGKLALGSRVAKLSDEAGRGLGEVAAKTKAGVETLTHAGKESIEGAATRLRGTPRADAPPPSGLEQLLAREATAQPAATTASDLPLFAGDNALTALAPPAPAAGVQDHALPPQPALKRPEVKAMAAPRLPRIDAMTIGASPLRIAVIGLGAVILLAATFWLGSRSGGGMNRSEVETIVADYIRANPQIIPEALEAQRGQEIAQAIDAIRPALEKPYAGAWAGNADGDVTLVVFTDYACGFCRASVPDVDRLLREDRRLKVVFRELPIIAPQSRDAALMALAAARQGKYDAFHHAMFAAGSLQPAAIAAAATRAGVVTDGSADATANEALFQRELDSNLAIATQLQLNATPTWIVGDQLLQGQIGYDALRQAVAKARAEL